MNGPGSRGRRLVPRVLAITCAVILLAGPTLASSFYFSPDVTTDDPGGTGSRFFPWSVVRVDDGSYGSTLELPDGTPVAALHLMASGDWLFAVEATTELPPGSGQLFAPRDVVRFDGAHYGKFFDGAAHGLPPGAGIDALFLDGGDAGDLVVSLDASVTLDSVTYEPSDLLRWSEGSWSLFFDASATTPPVPPSGNLTGADTRGGDVLLVFDVATTLDGTTYAPGEVIAWNEAGGFTSFFRDPAWPRATRFDALAMLAPPGDVGATVRVAKSDGTGGTLRISWGPSCSVGAEDYGIYEGTIGDWYSHAAITCTDAGHDLEEEIVPAAGNRYYLVIAQNADAEGSAGTDSSGNERPGGGPATCRDERDLEACR